MDTQRLKCNIQLGYETDVASNGVEAMTKLKASLDTNSQEQPFDVILMDLHMYTLLSLEDKTTR